MENEKVIIFNPAGFILKWIFSLGLTILMAVNMAGNYDSLSFGNMLNLVGAGAVSFIVLYFVASFFGFCLRATGNYIIAAVVFLILICVASGIVSYISTLGALPNAIISIAVIGGLIWLPVRDIIKAVKYYKYTV